MSHTPGPWSVYLGQSISGPNGERVVEGSCINCPLTFANDADARLISAAPDLLAACKAIESGHLTYVASGAMLRAAIAKAEGGP